MTLVIAEHDLIDLPEVLGRLVRTTFYADPSLLTAILAQEAERQRRASSQGDESES